MNYKEELYHYGKLGMKWGQRRAIAKANAENIKRARNVNAEDYKKAKANYKLAKNKALSKYGKAEEAFDKALGAQGTKKPLVNDQLKKAGDKLNAANAEYKNSIKKAKEALKQAKKAANNKYWETNQDYIFGKKESARINAKIADGQDPHTVRKTAVGKVLAKSAAGAMAGYVIGSAVGGYIGKKIIGS